MLLNRHSANLIAGVYSYKNARYEEAIPHFRRSVALDSRLLQAHLYLSSALAQQFIPGVETPDSPQYAEQAIAEDSTVMRQAAQGSADQLNAIGGTTSLISCRKNKAQLALIATTSALGRSSLYNQFRIDGVEFWTRVGLTRGYGEFQFLKWDVCDKKPKPC